jgi:hypothetical protein
MRGDIEVFDKCIELRFPGDNPVRSTWLRIKKDFEEAAPTAHNKPMVAEAARMDLEQEIYEAVKHLEQCGFYPDAVVAIRAALAEVQKPAHNSRYMSLVQQWTRSAQSGSNTDQDRAVYALCARDLHDLNSGK